MSENDSNNKLEKPKSVKDLLAQIKSKKNNFTNDSKGSKSPKNTGSNSYNISTNGKFGKSGYTRSQ